MKTTFFIIGCLLLFLNSHTLLATQARDIEIGMQRADVIAILGESRGSVSKGGKEVVLFDRGTVVLQEGKVVSSSLISSQDFKQKQIREARLQEQQRKKREARQAIQARALKVKAEINRQNTEWLRKANEHLGSNNYSEAVKWVRKAAEHGHSKAQAMMAGFYAAGLALLLITQMHMRGD